jgi:hypothetical protein
MEKGQDNARWEVFQAADNLTYIIKESWPNFQEGKWDEFAKNRFSPSFVIPAKLGSGLDEGRESPYFKGL